MNIGKSIKLLIFIVLIYTLICIAPNYFSVSYIFKKIHFEVWFNGLILIIISQFLMSFRWHYLINQFENKLNYKESLSIYLAGLSLIAFPGRTGEAIRSLWIKKRYNIPLNIGIGVTISERLGDLISVLIIIVFSTIDKSLFIIVISISIFSVVLYKAFIVNFLSYVFTKIISKIKFYKDTIIFNEINNGIKNTIRLFNPLQLIISLTLITFVWLIESFLFLIIFNHLNINITYQQSLLIRTVMGLGGAISLLPAGILTSETTSIALAIAYGSGRIEAITATLFVRFYTLVIPLVLGIISFFYQKDINTIKIRK